MDCWLLSHAFTPFFGKSLTSNYHGSKLDALAAIWKEQVKENLRRCLVFVAIYGEIKSTNRFQLNSNKFQHQNNSASYL